MTSRSPFQSKLFYYLNPNRYKISHLLKISVLQITKVLQVFEKQLPVILEKKRKIEKDCLKPEVCLYYSLCCS